MRKEEVKGVAAHTHNRVIDDELLRPQVAFAGLLLLRSHGEAVDI